MIALDTSQPAATDMQLYSEADRSWIAIILDCVMSCLGQPWRALHERLDHMPLRASRVSAILGAMRHVMDGRAKRTKIARTIRSTVLGHPALDDATRTARLAAAGEALGIEPSELESLLWIDLADERPVTLPAGRPDELRLAALANVDRIQRALRRARHVRIHAWGNAHPLIRTAARYGLLVRVSAQPHTVLDIVGPLSLFHQTQVYGRALGAIVPYLAGLERFVVELDADFGYGLASLRVTSPALLPPTPAERGKPTVAERIARALDRTHGLLVERDPPPLAHDTDRLFPDIAVEIVGPHPSPRRDDDRDLVPDLAALLAGQMTETAQRLHTLELPSRETVDHARCWYIEVVGFATTEYLGAKLARYAAAGIERVILVVDDTRAADLANLPRVVAFQPRSIAADLLAIIEEAS